MFGIGMQELIIILIICLLLFGATRLPEIGKSLGKAIKEFKKAGKEIKEDVEGPAKEDKKE
ncbi:MAG: Sec-independent protein translocase TatA [Candidatus Omnitrophica bacterium CG1_02_49_10]|nr:MAG: Sec-independent protein translocase TatA [Candidatus Omnitrophica bacterium CG1_02_49_10]